MLEVFERNHFDPEELHAHEEGDDGLGHVRRSFPAPKFTKLGEKFLLGRQKSETKKWSIVKNALLLLQRVSDNGEGTKANGHPLRSVDELQGHETAYFYTLNTNHIP